MNSRGVAVVLFFFIIVSLVGINANTITGAAATADQGVAVYVLPSNPLLRIDSPQAIQYDEGEYILLDYTAILIDTVWYNLDNGVNITINSSFYFTALPGTHTLYLYGNQSNGTILSDSVTFTVLDSGDGDDGVPGSTNIIIDELIPVSVEKEIINVSLQQGETKIIRLLVRNEFYKKVRVDISRIGLEDLLMSISETEFYLEVNESKEIILTFISPGEMVPDIYLGKIFVNTKTSQKEILLSVEVESEEFLFDVKLNIPKEPSVFKQGDEIISTLDFYNLGAGQADVEVEYLIKDEQGNIVFGEKQILVIGTSISLTKAFKLPDNLEDGNYIFYVKVNYDGKTASASRWFTIETQTELEKKWEKAVVALKKFMEKWWRLIILIVLVLLGILLLYLLLRWFFLLWKRRRKKKPVKWKKKIVSKKRKKKRGKRRATYLKPLRLVEETNKKVYK